MAITFEPPHLGLLVCLLIELLVNHCVLQDIGARTGDDTSEISTTSQQSLSVLSIIGVTLSLLGLIITLITFILFK